MPLETAALYVLSLVIQMVGTADSGKIETSLSSYLLEMVDEADRNHDGKIDFEEWKSMSKDHNMSNSDSLNDVDNIVPRIRKRLPLAGDQLNEVSPRRHVPELVNNASRSASSLTSLIQTRMMR